MKILQISKIFSLISEVFYNFFFILPAKEIGDFLFQIRRKLVQDIFNYDSLRNDRGREDWYGL